MPRITLGTVVKLIVWSLVVGAILAFLNITPRDILGFVSGWFHDVLNNLQAYVGSAVSYILLGAVVVVPIWVVSYILRALKGRS